MNNVEMNVMTDIRVKQSYDILNKLRLPNGMYLASTSSQYAYTWIRDCFFMALPFLDKPCNTYERTFWRILDMLREYEYKLDYHSRVKPVHTHEYIHARYSAHDVKEIHTQEWGHRQNDNPAEILWGIAHGLKRDKKMLRDTKDVEIVQKLVNYLNTLEYWNDLDSGYWEENISKRSSSIGSCVAALIEISNVVYVPHEMIQKGYKTVYNLFPRETYDRHVDLALLSLVFPYNLFPKPMAQQIVYNVETELMTNFGCIRYQTDSYYNPLEKEYGRYQHPDFYRGKEPSWTMGFPWLANIYLQFGDLDKADYYIKKTESVMMPDGGLPELYYAGDYRDEHGNRYNVNSPLGWSNALYILAKEKYLKESDKK